jgi:serine/threonine protein kinase
MKKLDYKVIRLLGEGGFGQVFEAEKDGKRYACKRQSKQHICMVLDACNGGASGNHNYRRVLAH